jgi:hypothetical protein
MVGQRLQLTEPELKSANGSGDDRQDDLWTGTAVLTDTYSSDYASDKRIRGKGQGQGQDKAKSEIRNQC